MQCADDDVQHGADADGQQMLPELHDTHHLWLKAVLLAVWVVSSFGVVFFARDLQAWAEHGQLGYWMAAQGAVLMFMAIALVYCVAMDFFERRTARRQGARSSSCSDHATTSGP